MDSKTTPDEAPPTEAPPLTILGAGYVGRALLQRFGNAESTHRQAHPEPRTHVFRLDDPTTWANPPLAGRAVVWTFPAAPLELVQAFHDAHLTDAAGLIVLGSTSAYRLPEAPGDPVTTVNERAPLDLDQPRVQGEEWLRTRGATVLQIAGIFGPGRDPADWLRRGRIRDGGKVVNLIHVDDIVATIVHLLAHPLPGERINVANGEPVHWSTLARQFREEGRVPEDLELEGGGSAEFGKRVDATRLRQLMPLHEFLRP